MAKTGAQRAKEAYDRKKKSGLARVPAWIPDTDHHKKLFNSYVTRMVKDYEKTRDKAKNDKAD